MNTTYKMLADNLFTKIKSYDFLKLPEEISYSIVINYIKGACLKFESCNQELDNRDDVLQEFNFELSRNNFQILVNYMLIEYLDSEYILVPSMLKTHLTSTDFHALNQYQLLDKITALRDNLLKQNNQLAINKSIGESLIFDMVKNRKRG